MSFTTFKSIVVANGLDPVVATKLRQLRNKMAHCTPEEGTELLRAFEERYTLWVVYINLAAKVGATI